jgi:hypothetical protein
MNPRLNPETQYRNVEAAAELVELALDDSKTVENLMATIAARLAAESAAAVTAAGSARTAGDAAALRADFVRRIAAVLVEGSHRLADIGVATRTRFSRLLTERLASGRPELLDAYQSFFNVLPSQNPDAVALMQHALTNSNRAVDDALRLFTPPASACAFPLPPIPAPADCLSAASAR